jgi:MoxR-like ATPase
VSSLPLIKPTKARRTAKSTKATTANPSSNTLPAEGPAPLEAVRAAPKLLCHPLGVFGWDLLEPLILASLASGDPLLVIGRHGTAKSFLLERLAQALKLEYRFYNASLLNYDDLVGIPLPNEDGTALRYLTTPTAVWDAQVVFIDEINRTRPELQNKLFPIIHERRVQGQRLERLRYRWAAMNPPPSLDGCDASAREDIYLGAEPLDPALADRFAFIVPVPDWSQLSDHERRSVLRDQLLGRHEFPVEPAVLVTRAETMLAALSQRPPDRLIEYLLALESSLRSQGIEISTRRVTMLQRNILAVHAARLTLAEAGGLPVQDLSWNDSAFLGVAYGLPGRAHGPVNEATLLAVHRQAWEVSGLAGDDPWKRLLGEPDPIRRAALACSAGFPLGDEDLGLVLLDAVSAVEPEENRLALCLVLYLGLRSRRALPHTVVETITRPVVPLLSQGSKTHNVYGQPLQSCREVAVLCSGFNAASGAPGAAREHHLRALLQGLLPDGFKHTTPGDLHDFFNGLWEQFSVESCYASPL